MNASFVQETMECQNIPNCTFFAKYSRRSSPAWRGFIRQYCYRGNEEAVCRRKKDGKNVSRLDADMMPSGQLVPLFFQDLP